MTRETVLARAEGRCERCGLVPVAHVHHRRPKGMGGTGVAWVEQPANLVALCRACHEWVHAHPADARRTGWLLSKWGGMADAQPITDLSGVTVWLTDDGSRLTRADILGV